MKATRESKPYCTDHVEKHPYVVKLLQEIEQREAEVSVLERFRSRRPSRTSFLIEELIRDLMYGCEGAATVPRLCRNLQLGTSLVTRIARVAAEEDLVVLGKNSRGFVTVHLVGFGEVSEEDAA